MNRGERGGLGIFLIGLSAVGVLQAFIAKEKTLEIERLNAALGLARALAQATCAAPDAGAATPPAAQAPTAEPHPSAPPAKCDPLTPPYQPCCGEAAEVGGVTEEAPPKPEDFRNGRMLPLHCARTVNKPDSAEVMSFATGHGPPWVCARTERKCRESKQRADGHECQICYVYIASGYPSNENFVWTGHALDEVDGPWTKDGKRGVFP